MPNSQATTSAKTAHHRAQILHSIRDFFTSQKFLEVETPILVKTPGMEPHLTPFETRFSNNKELYLNHSPELQMKRLLARPGFTKIFQITKVFRNGEIGGPTHNPEFTMLEWYRHKADYNDLIKDCQNLLQHLAKLPFISKATKNLITKPLTQTTCAELFAEKLNLNLKNLTTEAATKYDLGSCTTFDDIFFKLFLDHLERHLGQTAPQILKDYPSTQAALAKKSATDPFYAERFELYIKGLELANGFSELIDATEQRERLQQEQRLRKKLHKTVFPIDEQFLSALESISKPCAGIALGIDRLVMLLLGKKHINETLLFPATEFINH